MTMLERVARAIWKENAPQGAPSFDDLDYLDQGRVKMIARACMGAQETPTEKMLDAGHKAKEDGLSAHAIWDAMLYVALNEEMN